MDLMARRRQLLMIPHGIIYEGFNLDFDGTNYIDTGAYLFTEENVNRDFEFIAEGVSGRRYVSSETLICAKHNGQALGFLLRPRANKSTGYHGTLSYDPLLKPTIIIKRKNGVISYNDAIINKGVIVDNGVFDWPLVLGCAIDDDGTYYRYAIGHIDHVLVKWT